MRMDTRRSKSALESKKTSPNKDSTKGDCAKQGHNPLEQAGAESSNDCVDTKVEDGIGSTLTNRGKRGIITRSKGRSLAKEVEGGQENASRRGSPKKVASALSESIRDFPEDESSSSESPPAKKKRTDVQIEPDYIELSENDDEESSQDEVSSSGDPLQTESSSSSNLLKSKTISVDISKAAVTSVEPVEGKGNANVPKMGKIPLIKVKRVVKGANEGEITVLTSYEEAPAGDGSSKGDGAVPAQVPVTSPDKVYRTYSGPVKKPPPIQTITKQGKKYLLLGKASIKEMMEKGIIETIKKDGDNPSFATYRAILPKGEPSILSRIASASGSSAPVILNMNSTSQTVIPTKQTSNPAVSTLSTTFKSASGTSALVTSDSTSLSVPSKSSASVLTTSATSASVSSSTPVTTSGVVVVPSSGVKIQIPQTSANGKVSSIPQVITPPIFVKSPASNTTGKSGNIQVVTLPPDVLKQLQQIQKGVGSVFSIPAGSASSGKPIFTTASASQQGLKIISKGGTITTPVGGTDDSNDPDFGPSLEVSDESGEEGTSKQKGGAKYGVPTGVCKVLNSMKMYQFVDKQKEKGVPSTVVSGPVNNNIRWVAVPNKPGHPQAMGGTKIQQSLPSSMPISFSAMENTASGKSQVTTPREIHVIGDDLYTHYKILELRAKQKEQLAFHRKRYSELLRTYNELANKYNEIKDVGTVKQILTDAKKYMKKDHLLFFRNEMMLYDRTCNGNRYSPKFMMMLMKYYNRSHIGYRFLRHIFTLPAVRTLITWQNKRLPLKKKKSAFKTKDHLEITINGNRGEYLYGALQSKEGTTKISSSLDQPHLRVNVRNTADDSESDYDSESEVEDLDGDRTETNSKKTDRGGVDSSGRDHSSNPEIIIQLDEQ